MTVFFDNASRIVLYAKKIEENQCLNERKSQMRCVSVVWEYISLTINRFSCDYPDKYLGPTADNQINFFPVAKIIDKKSIF